MEVFHHSCLAMGTRFNLVIPGLSQSNGECLSRAVNSILNSEESRLSAYMEDSELSRINRLAPTTQQMVSDEMAAVLDFCQLTWEQTGGAFDAGLFRLKQNAGLVDDDFNGGWKNVRWNSPERLIHFDSNDTAIDLGGFGKGWALSKVIDHLKAEKLDSAFISFGESSITGHGVHPLGLNWQITISHPSTGVAALFELNNQSVSVSGLKSFNEDLSEKERSHIIRPQHPAFVEENRVVVVKSESPLVAEVLSTAVMAASDSQIKQILSNYVNDKIYVCEIDAPVFKCISF